MESTIQASIEAFLHNLHLDSSSLADTHELLRHQLSLCQNEAENLSAASTIPSQKFLILNDKI